uniref:Uncharacterized protein n=1 Tax=Globisporangium ultimum (strain ATCC 200006 / CBS 805.95 / DAOM BR144) TaxID=431595 RepID=K3WYV6_GLOUD
MLSWAILSRGVYRNGCQYSCIDELRRDIVSEWKAIDRGVLHNVVRSMPQRCIKVVERRGAKTHY